jgi:hypothetical protein
VRKVVDLAFEKNFNTSSSVRAFLDMLKAE